MEMPVEAMRKPEAIASEGELPGLFTAPLLSWLQELGCQGVYLIEPPENAEAPAWVEVDAPTTHPERISGWVFQFDDRDGDATHVLCAFADAEALSRSQATQIAGYLRAAGPFTVFGASTPRSGAVLVQRAVLDKYIHDLRNRLGSLLMNAHVLCSRLPDQARSSRFADTIDQDGQACADQLRRLSEVVQPSQSRGWG